MPSRTTHARWPPVAAAVLITLITLWPAGGVAARQVCLICGARGTADAILNVVLFLPLGLAWHRAPLALVALLGGGLSAMVECLQLLVPGRDPSLGDLVFNTLGTITGAQLWRTRAEWMAPAPARRGRGAAVAGGSSILLLSLGAALLSMHPPRGVYLIGWTPDIFGTERYPGHVLSVRLGARTLPPGFLLGQSQDVRRSLLAGAPLRVVAVAGPRSVDLAPIFAIQDYRRRHVLILGADGDDLVVRFRTRGNALRLDSPELRFPAALESIGPGSRLELEFARSGRGYRVSVNGRSCGQVGFTIGDTWSLLLYDERTPEQVLRIAWMILLLVPAGFWIRGSREAVVVGLAVTIGLLAIPRLAGVLATPLPQALAAFAGIALGIFLQNLARRREREARSPTDVAAMPHRVLPGGRAGTVRSGSH